MEHTYNYFKKGFLKISNLQDDTTLFIYLIAAVLIAIPLNYAFGSITTIVFILAAFASFKRTRIALNTAMLLPIGFYFIMLCSILWTADLPLTLAGLKKELLFLFIPLAFLFIPKLGSNELDKIFRFFSFSMVGYTMFFIIQALFRYFASSDLSVFFYHQLVTMDLNAIYVSVFASFALFYFISLKSKKTLEQAAIVILVLMIVLLSSKSIIFIDFLLIICHYYFFSDIPKSVRYLTVTSFAAFLIFSLIFVKQIRDRFLIEYETAFVDNTVNKSIGNGDVYNISLQQAWTNEKFEPNNFFPGTAMRIYQIRIFKEMLQDDNILFTGYGLEASQHKIKEKARQYNLYEGYGDFNFHNQYVQTFAELGVFGLLILIAMLYLNIKNAWKNQNFLHIVFAVTMLVLFLTESFFCRQRGLIFFITIYCLFNAGSITSQKEIKK